MKILQTTTATVVPKTGLALSDGQKIGKQVLKRYSFCCLFEREKKTIQQAQFSHSQLYVLLEFY